MKRLACDIMRAADDDINEASWCGVKRSKFQEEDGDAASFATTELSSSISTEARRVEEMRQRDLDRASSVPIANAHLVYVGKSSIGGLGVFAKCAIKKGTKLTTYEGTWIQPSFPIREKTQLDTHVLSLSAMDALDGIRYPEAGKGVGSLINSSRNTGKKHNAQFVTVNRVLRKTAFAKATRDIQPGEEILVDYNYV